MKSKKKKTTRKKKKKRLKLSKNWLIVGIVLVIILGIIHILRPKNIVVYKKSDGLYYTKNNQVEEAHKKETYYIRLWEKQKYISYLNNDTLYRTKTNNNKQITILEDVKDYYLIKKNQLLIMDKEGNLYIAKGKKLSKQDENVWEVIDITEDYAIYTTSSDLKILNFSTKEKYSLDYDNYTISEDKSNLLIYQNQSLKIYNVKKHKVIKEYENINYYSCVNPSCTTFYYLEFDKLYINTKKNKVLEEDVSEILYSEKNKVIYTKYKDGKMILYYKYKTHKSKKMDESTKGFTNLELKNNKLYYLMGNTLVEMKKNGKKKQTILEDVGKILDITYKDKYLIIKDDRLYWNDKEIAKNIVDESIQIENNKLYYKTVNQKNEILYVYNGKKSKKIADNVGDYYVQKNRVYYIGDYNIYKLQGTLYYAKKNPKELDTNVISIIKE